MHWRAAHGHSELLSHCFWSFPFNFSKLNSPFSESGFSFMDFKLLEQEHNLCVLFCYCSPYYITMLVKASDPGWKVAQNDLHVSMLLRPPECQAYKWAPRCSAQHLFFLFFLWYWFFFSFVQIHESVLEVIWSVLFPLHSVPLLICFLLYMSQIRKPIKTTTTKSNQRWEHKSDY